MALDRHELDRLKEYAQGREVDYLDAILEHGSNGEAAKALGLNRRTVDRGVARVKRRAAKQGFSPKHAMIHDVPDGYHVKGVSTLFGSEGEVKGQWVKSQIDRQDPIMMIQMAIEALADTVPREREASQVQHSADGDLLNCFVITDYHIGMKAWGEETGADWDTDIAEGMLTSWFGHAIECAPSAGTAILAQVGDFLHWDGMDAVTPASGHILDADTRFQKVVRVAIGAIRQIVSMLLAKHERVHLIMAEGNHDPASSAWLRELLHVFYENEPRVTVDRSVDPYYCYEHGGTSLFFHHGHKRKPENISDVFAGKYRDVFGRTRHSYAHMGHWHHDKVLETNLMKVEQHRTLAAPDAYAARGGWISGRDAKVITYSKSHGEVSRVTISADMVAEGR